MQTLERVPSEAVELVDLYRPTDKPESRARFALWAMTGGRTMVMNGQATAALGVAELWASGDWAAAEAELGVDVDELFATAPENVRKELRDRGHTSRASGRYAFYLVVHHVLGSTPSSADQLLTHGEFVQALLTWRESQAAPPFEMPWPSETRALQPVTTEVRGFAELDDETRKKVAEKVAGIWHQAVQFAEEDERVRRRIGSGGLPEIAPSSRHVAKAAKAFGIKKRKTTTPNKPKEQVAQWKRVFLSTARRLIRSGYLKTVRELLDEVAEDLAEAERERQGLG